MRHKKRIGGAVAGILAVSVIAWGPGSTCAYGGQGSEPYQAVDGNQIPEDLLNDKTVEFQELGSLIHANNVTIQNISASVENSRQQYTEYLDYFKSEKASAKRNKEQAKDDGDMENYAEYASSEAVYKSSITNYNKMLDKLDEYSANKSRLLVEKQLTSAAQSLMISYQSMALQREYMVKMEEVLKAQYENTRTGQQAGLSTSQNVLSAKSSWESAAASLKSLEAGANSLYQNLCALLGLETDGTIGFQKISSADLRRLQDMNLEEDTKKAINNNTDIINNRHDTSAKSTAAKDKRNRTLEEQEEELKVTMRQLYEEAGQAKTAYDAAKTGYESAEITWNNTRNKYEMGMLNNTQYLQGQMQYIQKKADYESADLNLFQAINTYWWAVEGII